MAESVWRVRLGGDAERDFEDIDGWTAATFGPGQSSLYAEAITATIRRLRSGPATPGARRRDDIGPGLWTLHVRLVRPRARHFLLYEAVGVRTIRVLRILHDAMDLERHLPPET